MDLVAPLGSMYQAGTLSGNPLAVTAGNATLDVIESTPNFYKTLETRTKNFTEDLYNIFVSHNFEIQLPRIESIFWIAFQSKPVFKPSDLELQAKEKFALFHKKALENGLYLPPSAFEVCFLSLAHSDEILEKTTEIINKSLD